MHALQHAQQASVARCSAARALYARRLPAAVLCARYSAF